ncbi:unnamed protein product [Closterium sp. NIES-64]|nr:unnamed protein product [Closterium sp. NIES-64]
MLFSDFISLHIVSFVHLARLDGVELQKFSPLEGLPAVEWEEAPPRPGCILTLDSRYSPEGVAAVEAAVARLLRELGREVGGGGRGGEGGRREGWWGEGLVGEGVRGVGLGGERTGAEEIEREVAAAGLGDGGQGRRGGMGGRVEGEVEEGEGEAAEGRRRGGQGGRGGGGGLKVEVKNAEGGKGEGESEMKVEGTDEGKVEGTDEGKVEGTDEGKVEGTDEGKVEGTDEGKVEGTDEGKVEGTDEGEGSKVKEEGGGRGGEAMPEVWQRLYSGLPKVVDAEGHENMWKFPIWVSLAVNMCVCAAVGMCVRAAVGLRKGHCCVRRMVVWDGSTLVKPKFPLVSHPSVCVRLYARRHGYRMVVENGSKYTPDRHPSWFKNYFSWLLMANLTETLKGQVWIPQDPALLLQPPTALQPEGPVALIPRNGDSRGGFEGDAGTLFREETGYINAGVMLWRRSPDSFKFFREWYNVTRDNYHVHNHVWEQANLNEVARQAQWRERVIVVPYRELTGPHGAMVRHLWGGVAEETRHKVVVDALEEALGGLQ